MTTNTNTPTPNPILDGNAVSESRSLNQDHLPSPALAMLSAQETVSAVALQAAETIWNEYRRFAPPREVLAPIVQQAIDAALASQPRPIPAFAWQAEIGQSILQAASKIRNRINVPEAEVAVMVELISDEIAPLMVRVPAESFIPTPEPLPYGEVSAESLKAGRIISDTLEALEPTAEWFALVVQDAINATLARASSLSLPPASQEQEQQKKEAGGEADTGFKFEIGQKVRILSKWWRNTETPIIEQVKTHSCLIRFDDGITAVIGKHQIEAIP